MELSLGWLWRSMLWTLPRRCFAALIFKLYTTDGHRYHRYLGSIIGSESFELHFLQQKVQDWIFDIQKLSTIAESQLILCLWSWLVNLLELFSWVCTSLFQQLEDCICSAKLLGRDIPGKVECDLFSLPPILLHVFSTYKLS